jgi:hypothetical protein
LKPTEELVVEGKLLYNEKESINQLVINALAEEPQLETA